MMSLYSRCVLIRLSYRITAILLPIIVPIDNVFAQEEAAEALAPMNATEKSGKIVLRIS